MNKNLYATVILLLMVSVSASYAQPTSEQRSFEEVLNSDGTLKRGAQGSFNIEGYTMRMGKNGEPIFVPQTQSVPSGIWSILGTGGGSGVSGPIVGAVYALAVSGNDVYVGGIFNQVNVGGTVVNVNNIARFNTTTNTWSALGSGGGNGVNNAVRAIAVVGSDVYVGGIFNQVNVGGTVVNVNNIARFNTTTNTWSALGSGGGNGVNLGVNALAVFGNDLYVGGSFTQANVGGASPVTANRIARFNTNTDTWSALISQDGGNGVDNGVNAIVVVQSFDALCVGGNFTVANFGGVSPVLANRVALFGLINSTWSKLGLSGNGVNNEVRALAVGGTGFNVELYVGGNFTQADVGSPSPITANRVARYSIPLGIWDSLSTNGGTGVDGTVNALAVFGNDLYVGGFFTQANVGGSVVNVKNIARFNTVSDTWKALTGVGGGNGVDGGLAPSVEALLATTGGMYIGGIFIEANAGGSAPITANNVARFSPNPSSTQSVTSDGLFIFPNTGVSIDFTGVSGSGSCTVERYDFPPSNVSFVGTPPTFTSQYGFIITASGFTFTNAELRFDRTLIPNSGIGNASTVNVYRRPTPGSGQFSVLLNTFNNSAPDEVRATTTAFSEFILGSNDPNNQLPVELTAFGFRKVDSGIELYWRTATELNNAGFEVQRRSENQGASAEWQVLGFVRGRGTTTEAQSYTFLDRSASGKVQYRLKQIDFDGQFEYSNVIEVDAGLPKVFALEQNYPNPFNPTTVISYQLPVASEVSLKVYDVLGKEVMTLVNGRQAAGAYNYTLNASNLSSGVYFYRLRAGNFVSTKKMMLVK
jgi:hypothetical protein